MKKLALLALVIFVAIALVGCGGTEIQTTKSPFAGDKSLTLSVTFQEKMGPIPPPPNRGGESSLNLIEGKVRVAPDGKMSSIEGDWTITGEIALSGAVNLEIDLKTGKTRGGFDHLSVTGTLSLDKGGVLRGEVKSELGRHTLELRPT